MFVGNGHDRSGIDAVTAMLYKIRIEYNIHRLEHPPHQSSEGDSFPPRGSLNPLRVFLNSKSRKAATTTSSLFTLHSAA